MVEKGNPKHKEMVKNVRLSEQIMRSFCTSLPEDRLLTGQLHLRDSDWDPSLDMYWEEPYTGAKLTPGSAMSVLNHYADVIVSKSRL